MARRKRRIPVVLDTNVFIANFLTHSRESPNRRTVRLWLIERKYQLVISPQVLEEYLEAFQDVLNFDEQLIARWCLRFNDRRKIMLVNLGARPKVSRDLDDNLFIATALAGKAKFLATNDKDLLDLPNEIKRQYKFKILTPIEFLDLIESTK